MTETMPWWEKTAGLTYFREVMLLVECKPCWVLQAANRGRC